MSSSRDSLAVRVDLLWAGTWIAWLGLSFALPVRPWSAARVLHDEERTALALMSSASVPTWAIDVGTRCQALALGPGWSDNETFLDGRRKRTFAWMDGTSAEVFFYSSEWPDAHLSARAASLDVLAPLAVEVVLDGASRGTFTVPAEWGVVSLPLGAVSRGRHELRLVPARTATPAGEIRQLSLAVDGLAVGPPPTAEPDRDRGVFMGWVRVGLTDRPALFVSPDAATPSLPEGTASTLTPAGLRAFYGFGIGAAGASHTVILETLHGMAAAALLVILSGLGWASLRAASGLVRLTLATGISALLVLVAFVVLRLLGQHPAPLAFAMVLLGLGGLPLLRGRAWVVVPWRLLAVFAAALPALAVFATNLVPPLEDQDMEVQATANALATRQTAEALTNRGTTSFFAHPPLVHVWVAGAAVLAGHLEQLTYYTEAARQAELQPLSESPADARPAERLRYERWKPLLRRFLATPELWVTRQTNVLLAALTIPLLLQLTVTLSGSWLAGLLLTVTLASFPEFLVRGSYGGYFAAASFFSVLLLASLQAQSPPFSLSVSSGLATLSDQKGGLVGLAWALAAPRSVGWRRLVPLAGSLLALVLFAAWGLATDPQSFLHDFVQEHVLKRLTPHDVRFVGGPSHMYPSIPELWSEFARHYGFAFALAAGVAALAGLKSRLPVVRCAAMSVLLGAVVFSLTDWRQTKHLSLLAAPALVVLAGLLPRSRWARWIALGVMLAFLLTNLTTLSRLVADFDALRPRPSW